jgi:hypothetical protein
MRPDPEFIQQSWYERTSVPALRSINRAGTCVPTLLWPEHSRSSEGKRGARGEAGVAARPQWPRTSVAACGGLGGGSRLLLAPGRSDARSVRRILPLRAHGPSGNSLSLSVLLEPGPPGPVLPTPPRG